MDKAEFDAATHKLIPATESTREIYSLEADTDEVKLFELEINGEKTHWYGQSLPADDADGKFMFESAYVTRFTDTKDDLLRIMCEEYRKELSPFD